MPRNGQNCDVCSPGPCGAASGGPHPPPVGGSGQKMDRLAAERMFVKDVETGGFATAAARLGTSSWQDFIKPGVQHPSRRFGHHMRGQRHNARGLRCSGGARALGRLRPIHCGHAQVHQDQVVPGPCCFGHSLDPVCILVDPAAGDPNDICRRGSKTRALNPARQPTPQNRQSAALGVWPAGSVFRILAQRLDPGVTPSIAARNPAIASSSGPSFRISVTCRPTGTS